MKDTLLNEEIISMHQSVETPPGKHIGYWVQCDEALACSVWARKMSLDGSKYLVALVNTGKKSHGITLDFHLLGWTSTAKATVKNLWNQTATTTTATGTYEVHIPSHGNAFVTLELKKGI